jgi:HEAT repeat protein
LRRLARVLRVQPGEGRTVALVVTLMFVTVAGQTIGESGVGALFFDRVGTSALPLMYLLQGATGLAAMLVLTGSLGHGDQRRTYAGLLLALSAAIVIERSLAIGHARWVYELLWLTASLGMLLEAITTWGTAGLVTDARRAKRLFPLFGAGSILGAIVGGLLTGPLARTIGAENLLFVWAAAIAASAGLCVAVLGRDRRRARSRARRRVSRTRELARGLASVRSSPLLMWMMVAAVLFSVLFFSLYLPFAEAASLRFQDPDALAGFLGAFWAAVTGAAFLVAIAFTNRLLGWFGAALLVLVLPVLYAGAFGVLLVSSAFTTLVVIRFVVNVWLQGVASPSWETLINVVPESRRDQTRAFLNGGPTQVGTAIAGVVQLVGQDVLSARQLASIGLGCSVLTIYAAWRIRRSYGGALVDALRSGRPSVFEVGVLGGTPIVLEQEGQAMDLALEAAHDEDVRIRRLAVEMLAAASGSGARDALLEAARDDDALVRAKAVRGLVERDETSIVPAALADPEADVRLAAVSALGPRAGPDRLRELLADPDPGVRAGAAVALLQTSSRDEAREVVDHLLEDDDAEIRLAALRQLGAGATPDAALAATLATDPVPAVRAAAIETLATAGADVAVPPALDALGAPDASVRAAAFDALIGLDLGGHAQTIRAVVEDRAERALRDHALAASVPLDGDAAGLLRDALRARALRHALVSLSALALVSEDGTAMRAALENLEPSGSEQLATALEAMEVSARAPLARSLIALWETDPGAPPPRRDDRWLTEALVDDDVVIRSCAELVERAEERTRDRGDQMATEKTSMSPMERVLELRRIPLFADLSPAELLRIAAIAEERTYVDGDVIGHEGEIGEELHIILAGTIHVVRERDGSAATIARRVPGDVVGEMSIISRAPRVASLVVEGDVRTISIGRREFESMIAERPDVSLAVMRVLAERLGAATAEQAHGSG